MGVLAELPKVRLHRLLQTALGAAATEFLSDETVTGLALNPDGKLWLKRIGCHYVDTGIFVGEAQADSIIRFAASSVGAICTEDSPTLSGKFPFSGERFEILRPPCVDKACFCIRKPAQSVFTLQNYLEKKIITPEIKACLEMAVKERKGIVIAGPTGTGKTTLANALLHEVATLTPEDRIVIIEDTPELKCDAPNVISTVTKDINAILKSSMRLDPTRIIIGEVRDSAAKGLITAANSGHRGGICTLHADSAQGALKRIALLVGQDGESPMYTGQALVDAVQIIVVITPIDIRRAKEIGNAVALLVQGVWLVEGFRDGEYLVKKIA